MPVISSWKITYDPTGLALVLVNHGDILSDELTLDWSQTIQQIRGIGGTSTLSLGRGNIQTSLQLEVWQNHPDHPAAFSAVLHTAATIPAAESKPITIELTDGTTYTIPNCAISSAKSRRRISGSDYYTITTYTITGGKPFQ